MELFFLALGFSSLALLYFQNKKRAQSENSFELIPNQLLTRRPILFVTGARSPFYFLKFWNQIPSYLAEHGFEVYNLELPWKPEARKKALEKALSESFDHQTFHLFIDASNEQILREILSVRSLATLESVTVVKTPGLEIGIPKALKAPPIAVEEVEIGPSSETSGFSNLIWRAHRLWTTRAQSQTSHALGWPFTLELGKTYLDRAKVLAERDLIKG